MKKHIKIILILAFFLILISVSSCELGFKVDKPNIYMISMGCDFDYGNTLTTAYLSSGNTYDGMSDFKPGHLDYPVKDAIDVGKGFEALAKKAGYNFNIQYLVGKSTSGSASYSEDELGKFIVGMPSYENFTKALTSLTNIGIKNSDILIIFFSTHGGKIGEQSLTEASLIFSDYAVSYDLLKKEIDSVKGTKIILCDSCHSGSFIVPENGVTINPEVSSKNPIKILFKSKIKESATLFTLTASTYAQKSHESDSYRHGIFTYHLLKAIGWQDTSKTLGNIAALKNNTLTLSGIAKYIYDQTENTRDSSVEDRNGAQASTFYGGSDDIILFKF